MRTNITLLKDAGTRRCLNAKDEILNVKVNIVDRMYRYYINRVCVLKNLSDVCIFRCLRSGSQRSIFILHYPNSRTFLCSLLEDLFFLDRARDWNCLRGNGRDVEMGFFSLPPKWFRAVWIASWNLPMKLNESSRDGDTFSAYRISYGAPLSKEAKLCPSVEVGSERPRIVVTIIELVLIICLKYTSRRLFRSSVFSRFFFFLFLLFYFIYFCSQFFGC